MKTKLTLSLWLRRDNPKPDGRCTIYCRIQVSPHFTNTERRAEIRTSFSFLPDEWDVDAKIVVGTSQQAQDANKALAELLQQVQEVHRDLENQGQRPKPNMIRDEYYSRLQQAQALQTGQLPHRLVYYPTQTLKTQRLRLQRLVRMQGKLAPEGKPLRQLLVQLDKVIANRWDAR